MNSGYTPPEGFPKLTEEEYNAANKAFKEVVEKLDGNEQIDWTEIRGMLPSERSNQYFLKSLRTHLDTREDAKIPE